MLSVLPWVSVQNMLLGEASGLLMVEMRARVAPLAHVHAHGRPTGGTVAAGGGVSAGRVADA